MNRLPDHPNARGYKGETPLHQVAALGHTKTVRNLLDAGGDPNTQASSGFTPLHTAASNGHTETVQVLLDAGGDPNAQASSGFTPLHTAASNGHTETVQVLLDAGGDPNAQASSGFTPLHTAASNGHTETVQVLLNAGADPAAACISGNTPLDLARDKGYRVTVRALTDLGPGTGHEDFSNNMESRHATRRRAGSSPHLVSNTRRPTKETHMPTLSIIGQPGSGKSHFATLLYIHMRRHPDLSVYCDFENVEWNTINNASRLGKGFPLEPTPSDGVVHDILTVSWSDTTPIASRIPFLRPRQKSINIPILDSAGELLQIAMGDILRTSGRITLRELEERVEDRNYSAEVVAKLYNSVFHADRFCFIVDAANEMVGRRATPAETGHAAFLQNLKNFREANGLPAILDSMLVFTKYDAVKTTLEEYLRNNTGGRQPDGMMVAHYLTPNLMSQLASLPGGEGSNPGVILSSTEWETAPKTESQILEEYGDDVSEEKRMDLLEGTFDTKILGNGEPVPVYSEEQYEKVVQWLKAMIA